MLKHENIDEITTRFMHIINQLKALGKRCSNAKIIRKILRSLSKARRPKVIGIQEVKNLNVLSIDALIRQLKTHETELNEGAKESNRKYMSITLKSTQRKSSSSKAMKAAEESKEDTYEDDDEDEIAHLA